MNISYKINVVLENITPIIPIGLILYISVIKNSLGAFIIALILSFLLFLKYDEEDNYAIED